MPKEKNNKQTSNIFITHNYKAYVVLTITCFVLYANTIPFGYTLDDTLAITGNQFTKKGFSGIPELFSNDFFSGYYGKNSNMVAGGRYRPLSLITFAIEYSLFGENPHISHTINILLYALTAIGLFMLFQYLLLLRNKDKTNNTKWYWSVPFLASLLFVVHPVHTEVVANIKGRDEILALLGSLFSLLIIIRYIYSRKKQYLLYSTFAFFIGLFSKENAITFLAIIPLSIYYFTDFPVKKSLRLLFPILWVTVIFLLIRQSTIKTGTMQLENDLMNNPFVEMTFFQKYATISYTLGLYLKLLFYPHPLTYDYYPYHIPIVELFSLKALIPLIAYVAILILAIRSIQTKHPAGFGLWFYLLTLFIVSNIVFPIGTFMNERFIYMPSVGFCFCLCYILLVEIPGYIRQKNTYNRVLQFFFLFSCLAFSAKTISRNTVWESNFKLFTTDVQVSANSSKGNSLSGEYYMQEALKPENAALRDEYLQKSIRHLERSLEIYPKNVISLFNLAAAHFEYNRNYSAVAETYKKLTDINPNGDNIYVYLYHIFGFLKDSFAFKEHIFRNFYAINPHRFDVNYQLAVVLMAQNKYDEAASYFAKAAAINPMSYDALVNEGYCYAQTGRWNDCLEVFLRAEKLQGSNAQIIQNIAIVYQHLGNITMAATYLEKLQKLKK